MPKKGKLMIIAPVEIDHQVINGIVLINGTFFLILRIERASKEINKVLA